MANTYVGGFHTATSSTTGQSVSLTGLGLQQNDIVVVAIATDDELDPVDGDGIVTAGYTHVIETANNINSPGGRFSWKRMGATPDTAVVIKDHGEPCSVSIKAFRGVDTTTAMDVTPPTPTSGATGMPDPPAIDPVTDGCMIVICGLLDDDNITPAGPTNYTTDLVGGNASAVGGAASTMLGHRLLSGSAAEDPGVFTATGGDDAWLAGTIALRPAGGVVSGNNNVLAGGGMLAW